MRGSTGKGRRFVGIVLELILGIQNIIFISILFGRVEMLALRMRRNMGPTGVVTPHKEKK